MFRSLLLLFILTIGIGVLTLGCSQEQPKETNTTESAQEEQAPEASEPETPSETETGDNQESAEDTAPAMEEDSTREEEQQKVLDQRKQKIDQLKSDGLILDITTEGTVTKVYVDDKFHDQKKRKQKLIIKNLYVYNKATNPEMKELLVYDKNTDAEIAKVDIEGFSWKYDNKDDKAQ